MKQKIFIYLSGVCLGLVPYLHIIATDWRGYEAFGSEFFIPLIPFLILLLRYDPHDKGGKHGRD